MLIGLVQIHHIIPQCLSQHRQLSGVDIHCAENVMFMPTAAGAEKLRLRQGRLIHDGGHLAYNAFVLELLEMDTPANIMHNLRRELRSSHPAIPWR